MELKIELGKSYRDSVSQYVGTATAVCEYFRDPTKQVQLTAAGDDRVEPRWVPASRLEAVD